MGESTAGRRILVASNRGPVSFTRRDDGELEARRGGGGLVSGLSSVISQGSVHWVCAAMSEADRASIAPSTGGILDLEGNGSGSVVQMLDIPTATFERAYNTVANSVLWFVHHMLYDMPNRPAFGFEFRRDWAAYRDYNAAFARALASAAAGPGAAAMGKGPVRAVVQDYHLTLVPRMLAELRPGTKIVHFSHTPWAPVDYYRLLPDFVAHEVLDGMLGADHVGFLCQRWADAFMDTCEAVLGAGVDRAAALVSYRGKTISVGVHPLGVAGDELIAQASAPEVRAKMADLAELAAGRKLIVRVDRTELSKNIVRGLAAYRELLITHPEWRGNVMMLALAYPSRHDLAEYRDYAARVEHAAREIEDEFATGAWTPLLLRATDDYPGSLAGYRLADVLLVNPIRDGMNLVAKEGPILSDRGCALVLSREAGAAAELSEHAIMINPFDVTGTAEALHQALSMPEAERAGRCRSLARAAAAVPPSAWFESQLAALDEAPAGLAPPHLAAA